MNYFRPKIHFLVEPYQEYVDILSYRNAGDKSSIIIAQGALETLNALADNSVDSIFLLDVIEHLEKEEGQKVIQRCERVAREQIVLFTPLGFMPQNLEHNGIDAWGLSGGTFQQHLSGWTPEDFDPGWAFHICKAYHHKAANGQTLEVPYGAFYAIRNFDKKSIPKPEQLSDLRIPYFTAYDAEKFHLENIHLQNQLLQTKNWQAAYNTLVNSRSMRFIKIIKSFLKIIGIKRFALN